MEVSAAAKYKILAPLMDERLRRHWAACEAQGLGRGGVSEISRVTGLSRTTIHKAIQEIRDEQSGRSAVLEPGRVRKPGAGRPSLEVVDKKLVDDLKRLVEASTIGDPRRTLLWTTKSTRVLADALQKRGRRISTCVHRRAGRRCGLARFPGRSAWLQPRLSRRHCPSVAGRLGFLGRHAPGLVRVDRRRPHCRHRHMAPPEIRALGNVNTVVIPDAPQHDSGAALVRDSCSASPEFWKWRSATYVGVSENG